MLQVLVKVTELKLQRKRKWDHTANSNWFFTAVGQR